MPVQVKGEGKVSSGAGGASAKGKLLSHPDTMAWRFGPAKVWYDQLGVSEDGSNLNYGLKLKEVYTILHQLYILSCITVIGHYIYCYILYKS